MRTISASAAALAMLAGPAIALDAAVLREDAAALFGAIPTNPPALSDNVTTRARVELGAQLFFDPRISASGLLSCNTCHNVGMGGVDGLEVSIGHGWQKGPRNAPTVYNAVFNAAQFWDGRAPDLAEQAKGPVQAGVEMNATPERVEATLRSMDGYRLGFAAAFPGEGDAISFDNMAKAIEAFEATLITPNARFDQFLLGDDGALDAQEKRGLASFMSTGCAACHGGVNFGGQEYFPFGVVAAPGAELRPEGDRGRFNVTETAADEYVFRAAPLRNIELTAPYFHSGKVWTLEEAVAVMSASQLGTELSADEISDITAFLRTLTGEKPVVPYPILPVRSGETPLPDDM